MPVPAAEPVTAPVAPTPVAAVADSPPNIVYVHSHDTGRHIQPYGYQVPTPNLQHLADQGILFRQAFCVVPTCSGSRACLLTGQYGHCNGMLGLVFALAGLVFGIFMLILDFDFVENGVAAGLPERESWRAAFGLTVSLVWIYTNLLRILAIFQQD